MRNLTLKPRHKRVAADHASLADFAKLGVKHETAGRAAFQALLEEKLVPEYSLKTKGGVKIIPDGAILDSFRLLHGLWEAKAQFGFFNPENSERVKRQKAGLIFVVMANPPYNAWQPQVKQASAIIR